MKYLRNLLAVALVAFLPSLALAQTAVQLPIYVDNSPSQVTDLGNGPLQIKVLQGNLAVWTMQGAQTATSAGTTAMTLAASAAANPPCIGCLVVCNLTASCSIPAGTTVTAFNGTTGVTTSVATTVTAQQVGFGVACPTSLTQGFRVAQFQAGQPAGDPPFYTAARLCATAQYQAGATILAFPIGAH